MNISPARFLAALLVPVALLLGGPSGSPSSANGASSEAPVASQTVSAPVAPLTFESPSIVTTPAPVEEAKVETPVTPAATSVADPVAWVHGVAAEAGLSLAGIPVEVTSVGNCGQGCTYVYIKDGKVTAVAWMKIQPSIIGTEYGKFVVLHEIGHTRGIINECEADQFAINHGATPFRDAHC